MNVLTGIKKDFKRVKNTTARRIIIALAAALLVGAAAVMQQPLASMALSPVKWAVAFLEPFIVSFLLYILVQKPKPSVFCFIKYMYLVCTPTLLMLLTGFVFTPSKADLYSQHFFTRFLPWWATLWWLGTALAYLLMHAAESAFKSALEKDSRAVGVVYALAVMYTPQKTISKQKRQGKAKWVSITLCIVMIALAVFIGTVTLFLHNVYSNMDFEAILFTIRFAAGGLALEDIISGTLLTVLFAIVTGYLCFHLLKSMRNDKLVVADTHRGGKYTLVMNGRKRAVHIVLSAVLLITNIALFSGETHFVRYLSMKNKTSDIYETYYVAPDDSVLTFPEKKRNLIYIYLESIENTYASKEAGGSQDKNYISGLTELASDKDSVNFSNTDTLGGASVFVPSITFTQGSTVAQTSGVSLNTKIFPPYTAAEFPNTVRLEDILHQGGYNQLYIEGSKGEFSMYDKYVGRYEDSKVFDRKTAADRGYSDESADYIWKWGIEDRKLIEITKELITDISQQDKPFFVTMYTMDTHTFETGHRCPNCDSSISSDYLASVDCSSRLVSELVQWIKQQPFYENTTVILVGDHLGNEKTTMVDIPVDYVRTTYNCIINPAKQPANAKNRVFSSLDMFPTTLSAIGVQINGDRLGLGTDLFSQTPTLCEQLGKQEYMDKLEQSSEYYDNKFYK